MEGSKGNVYLLPAFARYCARGVTDGLLQYREKVLVILCRVPRMTCACELEVICAFPSVFHIN